MAKKSESPPEAGVVEAALTEPDDETVEGRARPAPEATEQSLSDFLAARDANAEGAPYDVWTKAWLSLGDMVSYVVSGTTPDISHGFAVRHRGETLDLQVLRKTGDGSFLAYGVPYAGDVFGGDPPQTPDPLPPAVWCYREQEDAIAEVMTVK